MTERNIKFGPEAREKIVAGLDLLANAVKATLGPKGRTVIIDGPLMNRPRPRMTKDGVTVARAVRVTDKFERMGAEITKDAAEKQNEEVGDGTTTVTVLTQAIVHLGMRLVAAGTNPMDLRRGIEFGAQAIKQHLLEMAVPVNDGDDIYNVALISANGDEEIASAIEEAMQGVGSNGIVTVEESQTGETQVELVEGMLIDKGYAYPIFINRPNYTCELENPVILVFDGKLSRIQDLEPLLQDCVAAGRPILIIADGYEEQVMQTLVLNKTQGGLPNCPIRTPAYGNTKEDLLGDIVTMTGGQIISHNGAVRLDQVNLANCGSAKKVIIKGDTTIIVQGAGEADEVETRVKFLKEEIASARGDEKKNLQFRLACMTGGVGVVKIGGATDVETRERKDRVDDAIMATRAAAKSGVLPGGGCALIKAAAMLEGMTGDNDDMDLGIGIIRRAAEEPLRQIALNAGIDGGVTIGDVVRGPVGDAIENYGWNAQTGQYGDLIAMGVIDPAGVVIASIINAASVGGLLLTTQAMLTFIPEDKDGE